MAYEFTLNRPLFERLCKERGWNTQTEAARNIGVSAVTLSNVLNKRTGIGPDFIGKMRVAFPDYSTDDLATIRKRKQKAA